MKQYAGRLSNVINMLFYDRVVVIDAIRQQMIVRSQVTVHEAHRTTVDVEPDTDCSFVAL